MHAYRYDKSMKNKGGRLRIAWLAALLLCLPVVFAGSVPPGTDYSQLNHQPNKEEAYRNRSFRAYLPISEQSRRLKIGGLSPYENPTGIYYEAGEDAIITVSGGDGKNLHLRIYNSFRGESYDLHEGRNVIRVKNPGLAYVDYRSMTPQEEPPVQVKIEGGKINGVMTQHDDNATWKQLLAHAKCEVIDLLGERAQMVYWVEGLRKGCPEKGAELIRLYDEFCTYFEDDLLGFALYKQHTGGHILAHCTQKGYMSAGGDGVNLSISTMSGVSNADGVRSNGWGLAHEMGHIFQTRPGMKWAGMAETTNNICAMYAAYKLHPDNMRLEHSMAGNTHGEKMKGGQYDCFVNNALVQRQIWQFYSGPLPKGLPEPWVDTTHNVSVNLVPFWQLFLYNSEARGQKDFYPQIYQSVRTTDESKLTQGELRVLFFKRACDAAQLDFSEYFVKTGMLVPMDRIVRDYSGHQMTITRRMCEEAVRYASRYPKPESPVIYYISADSLPIFREKLAIHKPGKGTPAPAITAGKIEVPASAWKNAVAFEAYAGDKLLHISLFSLNHLDKSATTVICPEGTDCVKAVQWDGKRFTVLDKRAPNSKTAKKQEPLSGWFSPRGLGTNSVHEAALHGSVEALNARLQGPVTQYDPYGDIKKVVPVTPETRPSVNAPNEQGDTPLHLAARAKQAKMVQALLNAGADCLAQNAEGKIPRELTTAKKVVELLEQAETLRRQELALFDAVRKGDAKTVRLALQNKLNPSARTEKNDASLLSEAVEHNRLEIARLLLEAGADANEVLPNKRSALHLATAKNNVAMIDLLLKHHADPMRQAGNGAYAIHDAIWSGHVDAAIRLIPCYKSSGFCPESGMSGYPIRMAIGRNRPKVVKAFLDAGLNVNDARFADEPLLVQAVKRDRPEIVRILLAAGADKTAKDKEGKRAADYATGELAELLK